MSDKSNEQISNLMDGELEVNASKFLLKRMASDESLSKTWENYHLIKSCLQKEQSEPLVIDVASKVCAQLGSKNYSEAAQPEDAPQVNRWLKPLMGIGIAASVAFMSVFMLQNQQVDDSVINPSAIIAKNTTLKPIIQSISPKLASGGNTIVPPPSLSRFPSVSAKSHYNKNLSQNMNTPYLIIINQPSKNIYLSPMKNKDTRNISD